MWKKTPSLYCNYFQILLNEEFVERMLEDLEDLASQEVRFNDQDSGALGKCALLYMHVL